MLQRSFPKITRTDDLVSRFTLTFASARSQYRSPPSGLLKDPRDDESAKNAIETKEYNLEEETAGLLPDERASCARSHGPVGGELLFSVRYYYYPGG